MEFYREYYNYSRKKASDFKIVYLKSFIEKNKIYKFIAFDDNEKSNLRKLECLRRYAMVLSLYIFER